MATTIAPWPLTAASVASSAAPAPAENDGVDYRALLEAKLTRLHEHLREKAGLKEGEDFTDAHRAALGIPPLPPE